MKIALVYNLECVGFSDDMSPPTPPYVKVPIPDNTYIWAEDKDYQGATIIEGYVFTQQQIDYLINKYNDWIARKQRVMDEIADLIGRGVLTLSDAERWKLVGAVFYKLGVINSTGNVNPYSEWGDIDQL